ncbi:protein phosphatase 1 regulatory subunit 32 [Schistosoma japonicum]|nr:protein phosphatase 1 regulatory subunit 32 [Schistosoma japonicum]
MTYLGHELNYIQEKTGGEIDFLKHYKTSYTCSYGQCPSDPFPDRNSYCSSGFVSNRRPFLQYNDKICEKYNSALRNILKSNYLSTTHKDFITPNIPSRKNDFISLKKDLGGGSETLGVYLTEYASVNNNSTGVLTQMLPNEVSLKLGKINFCEIGSEKFCYGQNMHSTSYSTNYHQVRRGLPDLSGVSVGRKEESGSTHNANNFAALTNRFFDSYKPDQPDWKTDKSTGLTVYKNDFRPYSYKTVPEFFSRWIGNSSYQLPSSYVIQNKLCPEYVYGYGQYLPEGYLEDLRKSDLAEYQNVIHGTIEPSMSKGSYNGLEHQSKTAGELLNGVTIGSLEPSGSTLNISGNVLSQDTPPDRFVTHNMTRYYSPPPGRDDGGCGGNIYFDVQPSKETESSRSIRIRYFDN